MKRKLDSELQLPMLCAYSPKNRKTPINYNCDFSFFFSIPSLRVRVKRYLVYLIRLGPVLFILVVEKSSQGLCEILLGNSNCGFDKWG